MNIIDRIADVLGYAKTAQVMDPAEWLRASADQEKFFRAGRVDEWREVLTAAQTARLEDLFGGTMAKVGYEKCSMKTGRSSRPSSMPAHSTSPTRAS